MPNIGWFIIFREMIVYNIRNNTLNKRFFQKLFSPIETRIDIFLGYLNRCLLWLRGLGLDFLVYEKMLITKRNTNKTQ